MSTERERLEQHRDQALRDIVDLEDQVADGEIPEEAAQRLRADYEAYAARTLAALEQVPTEQSPRRRATAGAIARRTVYAAAGVVAVLTVGVLLPRSLAPRSEGGAVSGNVAQSRPDPDTSKQPSSPPRDLSTVSNAQMEAVIARNPNVIGMRLALAERYSEEGNYGKAAEHYGTALKQQPGNPAVQAQAGRLLLATDKPTAARHYVQRALQIDPSSPDALLLRAEILVHEGGDIQQARMTLQQLVARPDLDADLSRRAEDLLQSLQPAPEGNR